ncbi:platelet endothelial cell adhesion molecule [Diretmus argenteus]
MNEWKELFLMYCAFAIRSINMDIEPSTDVKRDTNVTVRCQAIVSSSGQQALSRAYTIFKDSIKVYTKTTSSSEDLLYQLPEARVSNTGKYKCKIDIEGKSMNSDTKKLTVTGLTTPVLHLSRGVLPPLREGEEVTARCTAPGEMGSIIFYFYVDSKEILEERVNSNHVEVKLRFSNAGFQKVHCDYTVIITPDSIKSKESNSVSVVVKELSIAPVLEIIPEQNIYEGDNLSISCTIRNLQHNSDNIKLYLFQGTRLLPKVNYSITALTKDSGEFECRLEIGNVVKVSTKTVSVTELFSEPTLTVSPAEVFQGDEMKLTCKSAYYASERIRKEEVTYTIDPLESQLITNREVGVFSGRTLQSDFNYTCTAQAKGIVKHSKPLTVRPKVSVSQPNISVVGRVILGRPFQIRCQSERGSLPINYTLLKKYDALNMTTIKPPSRLALFTVTIQQPAEIKEYMCEAQNNHHKEGLLSKRLNANVTVPLSEPTLTVLPDLADIAEGDHLYLICSIRGTPPVTFKWYRSGNTQPLFAITSFQASMDYQVERLRSEHSGTYYCEATNHANVMVTSQSVTIDVRMAMWKKGVIVASCLLVVAVLVLLFILRFRAKRGKREAAAELSVKPSSPKSDDSLTVNLTHDTEVYNAATVRVDRAATSVWSERPPNAASDEESSVASNEPDVEYTEVVHPQPKDAARVPLRKGTDTVYSELQNSPCGDADHHDYQGAVEYAELNGEHPEISQTRTDITRHQDLPVPVD